MIDDLIESVQRAEVDAHIYRDDELMEEFLSAHMLEASYSHEFAGVA